MGSKLKVLVHTRHLSIPGGKQTFLEALEPHFEAEITYFYYGSLTGEKETKFQVIKRLFSDYGRFKKVIRQEKFDLVHINTSYNFKSYFRDSIFTYLSAKKIPTLVYWHGWNLDFEQRTGSKTGPFFRNTFGRAKSMICLAAEFKDSLKRMGYKGPVLQETTLVDDEITRATAKREIGKPSNQKKKDSFQWLFLSRVEKVKGIFETLEAYKIVKSNYPGINLVIAGTGGALEAAKAYVTDNHLADITFTGWIQGKEKAELLLNSDLFVFPSFHGEGMPICILEAMMAGLPLLITNSGGVQGFFEEDKMGKSIEPKNATMLALKSMEMQKDETALERIGHYNQQFAKSRFTAKIVCRRLEDIYQKTLKA